VLAAAVVITAATSYEDTVLAEQADGASFLLTPEAPVVTVPFTFDATPAALEGGPRVSLRVHHAAVWTGVDDAAPERLRMEVVRGDPASGGSIPLSEPHCWNGRCETSCFGAECLDNYEVVFRWPDELVEGSARVEWSVDARVTWPHPGGFFSGAPTVPEGAALAVRFGDLTGGEAPPEEVAAWQTEIDPELGAIAESVTVVTHGPLDGGVLALETTFDEESLLVALPEGWEAGEPPVPLRTASSVPVTVPAACHDGPCTFAFTTLGRLAHLFERSRRAPSVDWAITATTPVDVDVVSRSVTIPEVVARKDLGRVVLEGAGAAERIRLVIAIPAAALPEGGWPSAHVDEQGQHDQGDPGAHDDLAVRSPGDVPIVALRLRPDLDRDTLEMQPRPGVEVEVTTAANRIATLGSWGARAWFEDPTSPTPWGPWQTPLANRCRPAEACEIDVDIRVRSVDPLDEDRMVAFDLNAEVAVLLPWTEPTPSVSPEIRVVTGSP
jgi:hypothetical protein